MFMMITDVMNTNSKQGNQHVNIIRPTNMIVLMALIGYVTIMCDFQLLLLHQTMYNLITILTLYHFMSFVLWQTYSI